MLPTSPTRGPARANVPQRQLSVRRGSLSAPDPHATRSMSPPRSASSRLTLVCVPPAKQDAEMALVGSIRPYASQGGSPRSISSSALSTSSSPSPSRISGRVSRSPSSPSRTSFASASFSAPGSPLTPTSVGDHRRSSSTSSSSSMSRSPRFSPNQIYDMAKASAQPPAAIMSTASPAGFRQLADDVYLPFVDRPAEISLLISERGNAKIMALVAQSLSSAINQLSPRSVTDLAASPESWSFEEITFWLTGVPREEVGDVLWVDTMRRAVVLRSEVLWERLKSMLGVPPELDVCVFNASFSAAREDASSAEGPLTFDKIHAAPSSSMAQLNDISEAAEDDAESISSTEDCVLGLRVSTPFASSMPPGPSSRQPSPSTSASLRSRSVSQSSVPRCSSPLAPKPSSPLQIPGKEARVGSLHVRTNSKLSPRSRESVSPKFPSSFDKIGAQPTPLTVI
ncbi:hypothetical protein DFH11DRAFT_1690483 [Phellopilus nigrolimitatus]|nr:hypothetical protein DFH11DRAFT_1690483 [Phellopilus nigrolimitatus]